jgi:hypothetical protein
MVTVCAGVLALALAEVEVLAEALVDGVVVLVDEPPPLHAAAAVTVAAASATAASARLLRMNGHLPERLARGRRAAYRALLPNGHFESF